MLNWTMQNRVGSTLAEASLVLFWRYLVLSCPPEIGPHAK